MCDKEDWLRKPAAGAHPLIAKVMGMIAGAVGMTDTRERMERHGSCIGQSLKEILTNVKAVSFEEDLLEKIKPEQREEFVRTRQEISDTIDYYEAA